jgi:hypothetical protein
MKFKGIRQHMDHCRPLLKIVKKLWALQQVKEYLDI